jgi:ADP-heptose:LPS heptosyltransferase
MGGIAVFRALQLGDMLCAVPALRALRRARPGDRIALVGLPWADEFAQRFARYVDEFIEFPGHPALPEHAGSDAALENFLERMRNRRLELAIQLHGSGGITNAIVAAFGAWQTAGFRVPGEVAPPGGCYVDWRAREKEVERGLRLLAALGIPGCGTALEFPLEQADVEELERLQDELGFTARDCVCVHAGARLRSRRWPAERFAAVADALAARGARILLTGSGAEALLCAQVARSMKRRPIDLAGRMSLGALAALISRVRLLVCNDTGVSHLAAAFGTRSVVVCSGADPARWAPLDGERHHVLWHPVACRPCLHEQCPIGHPCALGVPAEAVRAKALESLQCAA